MYGDSCHGSYSGPNLRSQTACGHRCFAIRGFPSVWTPHGLRHLRKQVFTSHILNAATGESHCYGAHGGGRHRTPGSLQRLHQGPFPAIWSRYYKAGCRMRSEFNSWRESDGHWKNIQPMDILRPRLGLQSLPQQFGRRSLGGRRSQLQPLCSLPELTSGDDSDSDRRAKPGSGPKKKKRKAGGKDDLSVFDSVKGIFTKNRKGIEICERFQKHNCGNGKAQSKCTSGRWKQRRHQTRRRSGTRSRSRRRRRDDGQQRTPLRS